jgi:hypothetical protein
VLITNNTHIAFLMITLHSIRHQDNKQPFRALKIYMTKSFDRVDWDYQHGYLSELDFPLLDLVGYEMSHLCLMCSSG